SEVVAGAEVAVHCQVVDSAGEVFAADETQVVIQVAPAGSVLRENGKIIAQKAGAIEVSCAIEALRLVDASPAIVEVKPGPAAFVVTALDRASLTAGERVQATCHAFDAFDNEV